jgi:hypothetical protein
MTKSIADAWRAFAAATIPAHAPAPARVALRRAFYAGASALFFAMMRTSKGSEADFDATVNGLMDEINAYIESEHHLDRAAALRDDADDTDDGAVH